MAGRAVQLLVLVSVFGVTHTVGVDGKDSLRLWQAGRIVNLADTRLTAAFPEVEPADVASGNNDGRRVVGGRQRRTGLAKGTCFACHNSNHNQTDLLAGGFSQPP